jgi:hypothetical protein
MLRPYFTTPDLAGRVANIASTLFRDVPLITGYDGAISGATLTTAATCTTARANIDVICLEAQGYAVVTAKDTHTVTLSTSEHTGLSAVHFCVGGVESFAREAYAVLKTHLVTGVQDRDGKVVAQGFADVIGDVETDYVAAIPDTETIFNEPHKLLTLVFYFTSQFLPGGDRYKELANTFWQDYVRMYRNAVQVYASKLKAAGTITAATDNRCMSAIHLERV